MSTPGNPVDEERRRILAERTQVLAAVADETRRETWPVIAFRFPFHHSVGGCCNED